MVEHRGKIGILTLNGYNNYGNRLQNYATQEVLKMLGFDVETILLDRSVSQKSLVLRLAEIESLYQIKQKVNRKIRNYLHLELIKERRERFIKFSKDYLHETKYIVSKNKMPSNLSEEYDYFITGSDQVWNPYHLHGTSFYFLTFAEKRKRIAYAASFGITTIPQEFVDEYKNWLSGMHRISVREEAGAAIVKELIGKDVDVLLDPTLMLPRDKWLSIAKKPKCKTSKKYLLNYFLGDVSKEIENNISKIAKENKLDIINLGTLKHAEAYKSDPSEFIDLINSANLVCTDSFHGVAFSILMQTPFIVFERMSEGPSMFSRIESLLTKFKLQNRKWDNHMINDDIFDMDYSHISTILEVERDKTYKYLKEALNIGAE